MLCVRPRFWRFKRWLILRWLGQYSTALHHQGKEKAVDVTLDFMDTLVGYCHPSLRLD